MDPYTVTDDEAPINPLDMVEELVIANEWPYQRASEEEILVEIAGQWCTYRLYFVWQQDFSALQFGCRIDLRVTDNRRPQILDLLARINERLWLGHFDLSSDDTAPIFRHTLLLRGAAGASQEQIEDLVEISLVESERFYPAFQTVIWGGKQGEDAIAAAVIEPIGEA